MQLVSCPSVPAARFAFCLCFMLFLVVLFDEPRQNQGRGLVDRKLVQAPPPSPSPCAVLYPSRYQLLVETSRDSKRQCRSVCFAERERESCRTDMSFKTRRIRATKVTKGSRLAYSGGLFQFRRTSIFIAIRRM